MIITFANKKLEKYAGNYKTAVKKLGKKRADLFIKRLDDIRQTNSYEELKYLPGNYHDLKSNRKGQWACDLDHPYRLIFQPVSQPIPTNESGVYILVEITDVEIIEIKNYHKKGK